MGVDFADIKAKAPAYAEPFCRRYLSGGKKQGVWWIAPVPWRTDRNPSLIVSLTTGHWEDCSRKDHGDLADLYSRIENCGLGEARDRLAQMMGLA